MKKLNNSLLLVSLTIALSLVAGSALASEVDVSGENNHTGADSDNENEFNITEKSKVNLTNKGNVDNTAKGAANTGDNVQDKNTKAGDLDTGDVDVSTDWETVINEGVGLTGLGDGLEVDGDFVNYMTGSSSDNVNTLDLVHRPSLKLRNVADVLNRLGLKANTGTNDQTENTTAGDIDTGDIDGDFAISNWANNDSGVSVSGSTSVDVSGKNSTTGANSDNENTFDIRNRSKVSVRNYADLSTRIKAYLNTGNNTQDKNTVGGDLHTGDIDVSTDITNVANAGSSMSGSGSGVDVTGDFSNKVTGASSNNVNTLDVENKSDVKVKNDAEVDNSFTASGNTGGNE